MVLQLPADAVVGHVLGAPGLHEWFEGAGEVGNPDALLLALRIRERVSVDSKMFGKLLPTAFSHGKLFAADHLSSLVNCLKVVFRYTSATITRMCIEIPDFLTIALFLWYMAGIHLLSAPSA